MYVDDISQLTPRGLVIDHDELLMSHDEDMVRLKKITDLNFQLIGKDVETESGRKVGRVTRYAVDTKSFGIMQINVAQPMTVNFGKAEVIIHRNQIMNVTDKKIIVKDASVKVGAKFGFRGLLFGRQNTADAKSQTRIKK